MHAMFKGAAIATAAVLVLTGCGGSGERDGEGQPANLVIGSADPVPNLTPGRQTNAYGVNMAVFSPLTFVDSDGEMTYVAASSIDSSDQQTWTITLRDGWTFHDGSPVTAQDYVDSWNAVAYGPNAFENSGQLAGIKGYADLNPEKGEPKSAELSGLKVTGELTFTVELSRADSQFPIQLSQAQTAFFPMPKTAFDDLDAYGKMPVGNGPFELTDGWTEGEPIIAEAYDDYAGDEPGVDSITWQPYSDNLTAYNDALAGNVDIQRLPATRMNQVNDDFDAEHIYSFDGPAISYLSMPFWDARFEDKRVRQAISMAIDRKTISDKVYGGLYKPATAWTPSIMPDNPDGVCGEYCEYDPQAAKALLDEAGGFDGQLTLNFPGGAGHEDLYNAIANYLKQNLDIDAVAKPSVGWAEFTEDRKKQKLDGPFFARWGALYPSQQSTLRAFFSDAPSCTYCGGAPMPEVEEALNRADATDDSVSAYGQIQESISTEFPVVPMFEETYNFVTSDRVSKLSTSAVGEPVLTDVVVSGD